MTTIEPFIITHRQIMQTDLGPIEYAIEGSHTGPTLLAIHGGMGGVDQGTLLAKAAIAPDHPFTTIAVSRPGYLGTPLHNRTTPAEQADLLALLLDRLDVKRATVVAISAGGPSAIEFAARHPERCQALILISCCMKALPVNRSILARLALFRLVARSHLFVNWMRKKAMNDQERMARRSIPDPELLRATIKNREAWHLMQALQSSLFQEMAARLPGTINDTRLFARSRPIPFSAIQCPTLIIHGNRDTVVPFDHAETAAKNIAGARLITQENAGHVALFSHLERVRRSINQFMTELAP
ncbi:alpha/beta fold hydrolase [Cohaesibacter haloalkalitolerans]|uniref:alpha/beta fold hydrolase n=1 Tax=Cohaesibacter haloalkalitolerans TaxID=1162980 RepID=UPI000E655C78|nr:alpha/beta hydrolase [Cohaesibacter haloalkalitolerans]